MTNRRQKEAVQTRYDCTLMPKFAVLLHARPLEVPVEGEAPVKGGVYAWRGVSAASETLARSQASARFRGELLAESGIFELDDEPLAVYVEQVKVVSAWKPLTWVDTSRVFYTDREDDDTPTAPHPLAN